MRRDRTFFELRKLLQVTPDLPEVQKNYKEKILTDNIYIEYHRHYNNNYRYDPKGFEKRRYHIETIHTNNLIMAIDQRTHRPYA